MALIVNGTEIENVIVIRKTSGESVEIEQLQDTQGNVIWELNKNSDVIIGISVLDVSVAPQISLGVYKLDENPNTIDWGDGTIEPLTPTNVSAYEFGTMNHTYAQNGDYDIKISGKGLIKLGTYGTANDVATRAGIFNQLDADGSVTDGIDDTYIVPRYYKIGTVCTTIASPFGTSVLDPVFPRKYQHPVCCFYNIAPSPYVFTTGEGVSKCFYNPSLSFEAMRNQVNKVLYNNPQTKYDFAGGFEGDGYLLITGIGSAFDLKTLRNYPFTGVGYLSIPSGAEVEFPETLTTFIKGCFEWNGNATLKFLTPSGVDVTMPDGFTSSKSARQLTIYTDNETIKNYNWVGANLTPTFYHLDGTAWA